MKKIGYIVSEFPVLTETFITTEIRAMEKIGHNVQIIGFKKHKGKMQPSDDDLLEQSVFLDEIRLTDMIPIVFRLRFSSIAGLIFICKQKNLSKLSLLYSSLKLAFLASKYQCDHLHSHFALSNTAAAIVAGKILNIPVSFVGHGFDIYVNPSDLREKLRFSSFAIAVCRDMADHFRNTSPSSRVNVVHCGVDTSRFKYMKEYRYKNNKILFIGRLCEKKGLHELIMAIQKIPTPQRPYLDIVGDGGMRDQLHLLIDKFNLNSYIKLLGSKSSNWLIDNANSYRALVVPFKKAQNGDRDTGPVVVKEAMAMGIPVITTNFMGCKEIITEDCGIRVSPNNIHELSRAIKTMMNLSEEKISLIRLKARKRIVENFSDSKQAEMLSNLIELS